MRSYCAKRLLLKLTLHPNLSSPLQPAKPKFDDIFRPQVLPHGDCKVKVGRGSAPLNATGGWFATFFLNCIVDPGDGSQPRFTSADDQRFGMRIVKVRDRPVPHYRVVMLDGVQLRVHNEDGNNLIHCLTIVLYCMHAQKMKERSRPVNVWYDEMKSATEKMAKSTWAGRRPVEEDAAKDIFSFVFESQPAQHNPTFPSY